MYVLDCQHRFLTYVCNIMAFSRLIASDLRRHKPVWCCEVYIFDCGCCRGVFVGIFSGRHNGTRLTYWIRNFFYFTKISQLLKFPMYFFTLIWITDWKIECLSNLLDLDHFLVGWSIILFTRLYFDGNA